MTIPNACRENWHTMTEVDKGRYCMSCRKNVIDFTNMSDQEILQHITSTSGNICGLFHADQVNRNMTLRNESRLSWLKYFLRFTLPAFFISMKAEAQEVKKPAVEQTEPQKQLQRSKVEMPAAGEWMVCGRVLTDATDPVYGASVSVKGTCNSTITDMQGYFKLVVPSETEVDLLVGSVGFQMLEMRVKPSKDNRENSINLVPETYKMKMLVLGGLHIVEKPRRSPLEIARSIITPDSVKIFPNPVVQGNNLNLELTINKPGEYYVEVTDLNGRLMIKEEVQANAKGLKASINTKQLLAGRYIVAVRNGKGKTIGVKKIIVQ